MSPGLLDLFEQKLVPTLEFGGSIRLNDKPQTMNEISHYWKCIFRVKFALPYALFEAIKTLAWSKLFPSMNTDP